MFGWVVSFALGFSVTIGVYDWMQGNVPSMVVSVLYLSLKNLAFSLGLAYVTIACMTGHGGKNSTFLCFTIINQKKNCHLIMFEFLDKNNSQLNALTKQQMRLLSPCLFVQENGSLLKLTNLHRFTEIFTIYSEILFINY